jgi:hypothetical protein
MIKWKNTACVDGSIRVFEGRVKFESRKETTWRSRKPNQDFHKELNGLRRMLCEKREEKKD